MWRASIGRVGHYLTQKTPGFMPGVVFLNDFYITLQIDSEDGSRARYFIANGDKMTTIASKVINGFWA